MRENCEPTLDPQTRAREKGHTRRFDGRTRTTRRVLPALFASITLLALAEPGWSKLPKAEDWIVVRSENFTVFTDARKGAAENLALDLELLRGQLILMTSTEHVSSPKPTSVFLFKNQKSFRPYLPRYQGREKRSVAGFFLNRYDGNFITVRADRADFEDRAVLHEYLHYFHSNTSPWMPTWLSEGMAEFYSTFRRYQGHLEIGRPIAHHQMLLASVSMIDLEELMTADSSSALYNERDRSGVFYAQSWALTHYFLSESSERLQQLERYLQLRRGGEAEAAAFRAAFGIERQQLLTELVSYLRSPRFRYARIKEEAVPIDRTTSSEDLPWTDTLCRLGELRAHMGRQYSEHAYDHFEAALETEPATACALRGLGYLEREQGNLSKARDYFERARELDGSDYYSALYLGETLRMQVRQRRDAGKRLDATDDAEIERARQLFEVAIDSHPEWAEAYVELGRTYLRDPCPECGIAPLERGSELMPFRMDAALDLLVLYSRDARVADAERLWGQAFAPLGSEGDFVGMASLALYRTWLEAARRLAASGRVEEQQALLQRALSRTTDPKLRAEIQTLLTAN